jgi:multiple sugar transport system ATP-binding protein
MSAIVFDKVSKDYDGQSVIEQLDLEVSDGELLVLVGPSGCGKSTLLRMVAGLEEISGGEIRIGGRLINDLPPQRRNLAMVFQNYALYPHMTVRRNLAFPLKMQGLARSEVRRRVEETAKLLDLTALLERRPKQLSGGQRQRVAMGRALVREADLFLMDEPLSNLDARLRGEIRSEIAALQSRLGITTLYVTHDQVEAMTLGQRVAVMRDGRLQQVADPRTLYRHPANIFVAGFIGSPGMNLLRVPLAGDKDHLAVRVGDSWLTLPDPVRQRHPKLARLSGQEVLMGLRPEAISLDTGDFILTAEVQATEYLGHETLLHVSADITAVAGDADHRDESGVRPPNLTAVLPGHRPMQAGERLKLHIDTDGLNLFDLGGTAIS